jgi:hypothetical protein
MPKIVPSVALIHFCNTSLPMQKKKIAQTQIINIAHIRNLRVHLARDGNHVDFSEEFGLFELPDRSGCSWELLLCAME